MFNKREALYIVVAGLFAACLTSCYGHRAARQNIDTVEKVDLQRYSGKWYEIARFENHFEKGCSNVFAEYEVLNENHISVKNSCTRNGRPSIINGTARVVEGSGGSKLKVRFKKFPANLFEGDYWIVMLDKDYKWVAVSDKHGEYLWIMSRTPVMDNVTYNTLVNELNYRGLRTEHLILTEQSEL